MEDGQDKEMSGEHTSAFDDYYYTSAYGFKFAVSVRHDLEKLEVVIIDMKMNGVDSFILN